MLTTNRLCLRRCSRSDVDAVLAYRSRPDVARHLSSGVWSREKAEAELPLYEDADFSRAGDELVLLVETLGSRTVIGEVGLVWLDRQPTTAEVGYVFDPRSGGHGFATEAVAAVIGAAFDTFGFTTVTASTDEKNLSSRALCERLGMRLASLQHSEDGRDVRECTYTIDAEQFARKAPADRATRGRTRDSAPGDETAESI